MEIRTEIQYHISTMTVSFQRGTKVHNPQVLYKTEQVLLQNLPLLEWGGCAGLTSARQTFTVPFYLDFPSHTASSTCLGWFLFPTTSDLLQNLGEHIYRTFSNMKHISTSTCVADFSANTKQSCDKAALCRTCPTALVRSAACQPVFTHFSSCNLLNEREKGHQVHRSKHSCNMLWNHFSQ